ncbi:hypothetical protein NLU13_3593 [Sarocladium strictum]|uniref:Uncharacterized protein n=1 Tax=Sarocladium strictum TaxID=5046 RepID=A0AA39LAJ9_SARSR|nr:hypothetical protein NLU13_3593 [Sarocladium strictum]
MSFQWSSSPVLTMSPQPSHQSPFGVVGFPHQQSASQTPFGTASTPSSFTAPQQSAPTMSRKRSRDEASANLEPDAPSPRPRNPEEGWVYGPGMTLIKPNQGYAPDAGTQSGTWVEEKRESEEATRRKLEEARRPIIRSHKSQRIDRSCSRSPLSFGPRKVPLTSDSVPIDTSNKLPAIDNFAIHLGIGWKRISEEQHLQAAARGWARFIENHYPITNVHVRLESHALQSYLVESNEGFFLFAENLRQGRLVSHNIVGAMQNLQSNPPTFDGAETLYPQELPKMMESMSHQSAPAMDAEMTMG